VTGLVPWRPSATTRGVIVGLVQVALALSVAGKYLRDRAILPRAWARVAPVDPELPIRGRYLRLRLIVVDSGLAARPGPETRWSRAKLTAEHGALVARPSDTESTILVSRVPRDSAWSLVEPVAFFLPEHAPDPSRRAAGGELWAQVSVPRSGSPRPVSLGVRRAGVLTPLASTP
jgi:hypothetical protein